MTNTATFHPSKEIISAFAKGELSTGMSVALSAHIDLCEACHSLTSEMEAKAIASWQPVANEAPVTEFTSVMSSIVNQPQRKSQQSGGPSSVREIHMLNHSVLLPRVLAKAASKGLAWKKLSGGINQALVKLDNETQCEFIYMTPGSQVPVHKHQGSEVTLVLDGSFSDELGHYRASDFVVRAKEHLHRPASEEGCLCFAVLDSPLTFTEGLARLMNPFLEYKFRKSMAQRVSR